MKNQSTTDSRSKEWRNWFVLFLRWLLGGLAGFGVSAWICYGYITHTVTGPLLWLVDLLPILSVPFIGSLLLFDPSFFGNNDLIDSLVHTFPNIDYDFLVVVPPSLIWGVVGALFSSGRRNQVKAGTILLGLIVIVGFISFFRIVMMIPT